MSVLDAALQYAEHGIAVIPLKPRDKIPATAHGSHDASTDPEQIRKWFQDMPDANLGIATGGVSGGLVVIDVDNDQDKGKDGASSLRAWEKLNGELPETVTCLTGSGGAHYYYMDPNRQYKNAASLIPDVDVRGEGGYVVAPPSIHPNGHPYEWEADHDLFDFLPVHVDDRVRKFLGVRERPEEKEITDKVFREGRRVQSLVSLIGSLVRKGLSDEEIRAAVSVANANRCRPPLSDRELEKSVFPALSRGWVIEKPFWDEPEYTDLPKPFSLATVFENPPPLSPVLIEGVLRQGHKMVLSGPSKAGKSFTLMELAGAIAEGHKWMGCRCTQGKVLYINMEIDRSSCINRFMKIYKDAWGMNFGAHPENISIWSLRGHSAPLSQLVPQIIEEAKKGYIAVIIDPLYKVMEGDENSNSDISKMLSQFDRINAATGAAVIVAHHFAKGTSGDRAAIDRAAGAGAFARDPDALVTMTQLDQPEDVNKIHTAWRVEFILREFPNKEPYDVWFEYPVHRYDPELANDKIVTAQSIKQRQTDAANSHKKEKEMSELEILASSVSDDAGTFSFTDFANLYTAIDQVTDQTLKKRLRQAGFEALPQEGVGKPARWRKSIRKGRGQQG